MKYMSENEFRKLNELEKVKVLKRIAQGQLRIKRDRSK